MSGKPTACELVSLHLPEWLITISNLNLVTDLEIGELDDLNWLAYWLLDVYIFCVPLICKTLSNMISHVLHILR